MSWRIEYDSCGRSPLKSGWTVLGRFLLLGMPEGIKHGASAEQRMERQESPCLVNLYK
jgi:hypothetical protein